MDPSDGPPSLTRAEREVAESVVRGLANAEIARARGTSVCTLANHMRSACPWIKSHLLDYNPVSRPVERVGET